MHVHTDKDGTPAAMCSVKSGCLDGIRKEDLRKGVHIWTKSAVIDIPEGAEAYEGEPTGGSFKDQ